MSSPNQGYPAPVVALEDLPNVPTGPAPGSAPRRTGDPETLRAAYWLLRRHAESYRATTGFRRARERWEASGRSDAVTERKLLVHEWYARGIEAAARDLAEVLGVPEHEIEPLDETEAGRG